MPKPFHFKLQKILEYRQQLEEQAMMELARARQELQDKQQELNTLHSTLERHMAAYYENQNMSAGELWLWRNYKERLLQDISQMELLINQLQHKVDRALQNAVTKAKDRKLLEKLKTNQAEAYVKQESLKEQKAYDEMSTILYENPNL
jgi:flagellar FliJ protein